MAGSLGSPEMELRENSGGIENWERGVERKSNVVRFAGGRTGALTSPS
jgi:hypothetical protein